MLSSGSLRGSYSSRPTPVPAACSCPTNRHHHDVPRSLLPLASDKPKVADIDAQARQCESAGVTDRSALRADLVKKHLALTSFACLASDITTAAPSLFRLQCASYPWILGSSLSARDVRGVSFQKSRDGGRKVVGKGHDNDNVESVHMYVSLHLNCEMFRLVERIRYHVLCRRGT
jgi:hypothetical protein